MYCAFSKKPADKYLVFINYVKGFLLHITFVKNIVSNKKCNYEHFAVYMLYVAFYYWHTSTMSDCHLTQCSKNEKKQCKNRYMYETHSKEIIVFEKLPPKILLLPKNLPNSGTNPSSFEGAKIL